MARAGFEPRPCRSQSRRFNHSTTLPTDLLLQFFFTLTSIGFSLSKTSTDKNQIQGFAIMTFFKDVWLLKLMFGLLVFL